MYAGLSTGTYAGACQLARTLACQLARTLALVDWLVRLLVRELSVDFQCGLLGTDVKIFIQVTNHVTTL